jgi:hypothetical protein
MCPFVRLTWVVELAETSSTLRWNPNNWTAIRSGYVTAERDGYFVNPLPVGETGC